MTATLHALTMWKILCVRAYCFNTFILPTCVPRFGLIIFGSHFCNKLRNVFFISGNNKKKLLWWCYGTSFLGYTVPNKQYRNDLYKRILLKRVLITLNETLINYYLLTLTHVRFTKNTWVLWQMRLNSKKLKPDT